MIIWLGWSYLIIEECIFREKQDSMSLYGLVVLGISVERSSVVWCDGMWSCGGFDGKGIFSGVKCKSSLAFGAFRYRF